MRKSIQPGRVSRFRRAWTLILPCAILNVTLFLLSNGADAQWGPDVKLSTDETAAVLNENVGQCLIASGNYVHVVWADMKSKDRAIYYKRSIDAGTTWGPDTRISP